MAVRDDMISTFLHERDEMHGKYDMIKKTRLKKEERRCVAMNYIRIMAYLIGAWTAFQFLEGILAASADVRSTVHNLVGLTFMIAMLFLMMKCQKQGDHETKKTD